VQESTRIGELVFDSFTFEVFAPHNKKSQKFSHKLLIMFHLVNSTDFAYGLRHIIVLLLAKTLTILIEDVTVVISWELVFFDILIDLSEGNGVILF
jgi:hypothetical protein